MNLNICRCCLTENPCFSYNIYDVESNILSQLKECLPPQISYSIDDGLPRVICDLCWLRVQEANEFRRLCQHADNELKRRSAELKEKAVQDVLTLIERLRERDKQKIQMLDQHLKKTETELLSPTPEFNISGNGDNSAHYPFKAENLRKSCEVLHAKVFAEEYTKKDAASSINSKQNSNCNVSDLSTKCFKHGIVKSFRKNSYVCPECGKTFTRNFQLKLHLNSVHKLGDGSQYKCKLCQKQFASRHSLRYHNKSRHTLERPFTCQHCHRQFILRSQLNSHVRIHTGESRPRVFECSQCLKRWPTKSDLKTHMRSHDPDSERPFQCEKCEKRFFIRGHLISHRLVHSGEKPFACEFCERRYQSIGNLNNHMLRRHLDKMEKKFKKIDQSRILIEL